MTNISEGCKSILRRMLYREIIGGKHIPIIFCYQWVKHLPKKEHKLALKDFEACIKEGLVLTKPTHSGKHVFLNPRKEMLNKIRFLIE